MRIGVDFGGTKIEAAAIDDAGGFAARVRRPNPGSYDSALAVVSELVAEVEGSVGATRAIGIAIPGSPSPLTGLIRNANSQYLNGRPFQADLQQDLGRPVRLANDANCLALSEAVDGAGEGHASVYAVILGTGCGAGLVIDGQLVEGRHGVAAEMGHNPLPWATIDEVPGPACWCGQSNCLETWISGSGFARAHHTATGRDWTCEQIVEAMRAGDAQAIEQVNLLRDRVARALASVVNLVDPEIIVLGGGLSNIPELYEGLDKAIAARVFSDIWNAAVVPARWGDSSGVRGAARLWE
ncbi:ROK family protein [Brevundimonas pishanensis]|uniref:ROK family protein n=1 Tax=Brevundimonas pishanensis TaxID=2896315 RepID=UPI001FA7D818|nr:ROK family protein [Brevundimonas pishanensis]